MVNNEIVVDKMVCDGNLLLMRIGSEVWLWLIMVSDMMVNNW